MIRALLLLPFAWAACGGAGQPLILTIDLGAPGLEDDFDVVNDGGSWSVGEFGPGLRVLRAAEPAAGAGFVEGGLASIFELNGGFAVTVAFDLLEFPVPSGDGVNEAILCVDRGDGRTFRVVRRSSAAGECVLALAGDAVVGEAPTALLQGRLRIRREGARFFAEIAPPAGEFVVVAEAEGVFGGAAHVRLLARQGSAAGGPRTAIDVCFQDLVVGAISISGLSARLRPMPPL